MPSSLFAIFSRHFMNGNVCARRENKMRRKDIDTMREVRLWIRDLIIPIGTGAVILFANPDTRNLIVNGFNDAKNTVVDAVQSFTKKEESVN